MTSAGGVWRDRDFRAYWAGHTVSQVGTAVTSIALPLVALFELDPSAGEVGLIGAAEFLPYLLLTLPAGALVDRVRRRPLMVGCDLWRAAVLALVPIASVAGFLSLPLLVVVVFAAGAATVFFDVAYLSVLPSLVRREQIVAANGALETSRSAASVVGPGVGGALVGLLRAPAAVAADAASYLVSALCLLAIRAPEPPPTSPPPVRAGSASACGSSSRARCSGRSRSSSQRATCSGPRSKPCSWCFWSAIWGCRAHRSASSSASATSDWSSGP